MPRTFSCAMCGDDFTVASTRGRAPLRCPNCDPMAHPAEARARALMVRRQLEERARGGVEMPERRSTAAAASRETVALAVRRVSEAAGTLGTAAALRELAAESLAWADELERAPVGNSGQRMAPVG